MRAPGTQQRPQIFCSPATCRILARLFYQVPSGLQTFCAGHRQGGDLATALALPPGAQGNNTVRCGLQVNALSNRTSQHIRSL